MTFAVTQQQAIRILRSVSGECHDLLKSIERRKGWLQFPAPDLSDVIRNLRVQNYPLLYENEPLLQRVLIRGMFSPDQVSALNDDFSKANETEQSELLDVVIKHVDDVASNVFWPRTIKEQREAKAALDALSEEDRKQCIEQSQCFVASTMAAFHQMLSVMVHGVRLTTLVARAKGGDLEAFLKAVQIDTRILDEVPYFREMRYRAKDEGQTRFLLDLGRTLARPPYVGRIPYKAVYWGFSALQDLQLLDVLTHKEILDVFEQAGIDLVANNIEDVSYLTKRLITFRRFQKSGVVSMQ